MPTKKIFAKKVSGASKAPKPAEQLKKHHYKTFYAIFNSYGYFDIDDASSPLNAQQKLTVPLEDRCFISDLSKIIADCIYCALGEKSKYRKL